MSRNGIQADLLLLFVISGHSVMPAVAQARDMGVGRRLIEACIARALVRAIEVACPHTAAFMEAAVIVDERVGFRRRPEFDRDFSSFLHAGGEVSKVVVLGYWLDLGLPTAETWT